MSPTATQAPSSSWTTVRARYEQMSSSQFRQESEKVWEALSQVKDTIVDQVDANNLRPIDAIKSIACLTGSVFGYEEFHPRSGSEQQLYMSQGQGSQQQGSQQQKGGLSH